MLQAIIEKNPFRKKLQNDPTRNSSSSVLEVDKWIVSEFVIHRLVPITGVHPFPLDEQMLMVATVCSFKPTLIFEWGTHIGKSARIFWETCRAFHIQCEIHSIDLPDDVSHGEHPGMSRGQMVGNRANVSLHQGDGVTTAIRLYDELSSAHRRALFYIDGDHSYESVRRELLLILDNVRDPIILLHDTFFQDERSGYNVGPHMAIADCLELRSGAMNRIDTVLGLPGMTLLYPAE